MVLLQFKSGLQTCAVNRFLCGGWTTQVKRYSIPYCNPENSLAGGRTGIFSPEYWPTHASCFMCGMRQSLISVRGCQLSRGFHSSPGTSFRVGSTHFEEETFYDKLEIHPQSTSREVKEAFYKLSKRYHPDTNADNDEALKKFQSMSEAYEVLSNPAQRAKYDKGVLGRSSSVAEREQASHSFDKEVFYGARSGREGKPGG
ncbi:protein tumorous imaginal discs, mitochondrial isoform X3 [Eurytemora carolleeae]|nr:protein tumorous imaginal discs, mitochondrial isoform X2 [Eurytemora carolleeae]XP_023341523.1 protein tumorous imaginal discs, mitochondrial isoform X3 [Eurytemora carolleeae]|eukprot:XP_023341522.1 protein tumorous imaginal discs, mitochondrial-like isoform X2 [Eurytemora affinis]